MSVCVDWISLPSGRFFVLWARLSGIYSGYVSKTPAEADLFTE